MRIPWSRWRNGGMKVFHRLMLIGVKKKIFILLWLENFYSSVELYEKKNSGMAIDSFPPNPPFPSKPQSSLPISSISRQSKPTFLLPPSFDIQQMLKRGGGGKLISKPLLERSESLFAREILGGGGNGKFFLVPPGGGEKQVRIAPRAVLKCSLFSQHRKAFSINCSFRFSDLEKKNDAGRYASKQTDSLATQNPPLDFPLSLFCYRASIILASQIISSSWSVCEKNPVSFSPHGMHYL